MGSVLLIVLGSLLLLAGFAGCILPMLPGPPLAYVALFCVTSGAGWPAYTVLELVLLGALTAVVTVVDLVLPVAGARKRGASKAGVWLSVVGLAVGTFVFPPFGFLVGAFAGALAGEVLAGKGARAFGPAWGVFVGTVAGVGLKLGCCGVLAWYFALGVWGR
ncbi:MAG TPA: DUF456 domain-containing protein [Planctomycetota bacterium]|nr:DUF456 domain-containing protein [Planctomycetota bacterium]